MLDLETNFPTQHTVPSAEYPNGSALNTVVPGDGIGTPWVKLLIDDIIGPMQAKLQRAGINPSGSSDNAVVSQLVEAEAALYGRTAATMTELRTRRFEGARIVTLLGFAAAGDGGLSVWRPTGTVSAGDAGTLDVNSALAFDADGREFALDPTTANPRALGAVGDGVADDSDPMQAVFDVASGGGVVRLPAGVYLCTREILMFSGVLVLGEGAGRSVISFAGAAPGAFPGGACITATGAVTAVPDLSVNVAKGDSLLTFGAAHGVTDGDVLVILDPTNNSLSPAQLYYRAGEFVEVDDAPTTTTVTARGGAFDAYVAATVDVGVVSTPMRVGFHGVTVRGLGTTETISAVAVTYGRDVYVRDVEFTGSQAPGLLVLDKCFGVDVRDVRVVDVTNPAAAGRYGVAVRNSQGVSVSGLRGSTTRGVLWVGGADTPWAPPSRLVDVSDLRGDTVGQFEPAVSITGAVEFWRVSASTFAGIRVGGNHGQLTGCTVYGASGTGGASANAGAAVEMLEAHGLGFALTSCTFLATVAVGASRALVLLADTATAGLAVGGQLHVASCRVDMQGLAGQVFGASISTASIAADVVIHGCTFAGGDLVRVTVGAVAGAQWRNASVSACLFEGCELSLIGAENNNVSACDSVRSFGSGISITDSVFPTFANKSVSVRACTVREAEGAGVFVSSAVSATPTRLVISGCESVDNNQAAVGGNLNSSFRLASLTLAVLTNNVVGNAIGSTQNASYYTTAIADLTAISTTTLGGVTADITATNEHRFGDRTPGLDEHHATGALGLAGGDPAVAVAGAADLMIGTGAASSGNKGITLRSESAGESRLAMGTTISASEFEIVGDHDAGMFDFRVAGATPLQLAAAIAQPAADVTVALGGLTKRWNQFFAKQVQFERLHVGNTTPVDSGDFTLTWPNTSTVTYTGADGCCSIDVLQSATGSPSGALVQYTYEGGAYANPPHVFHSGGGDFAGAGEWRVTSRTTTSCILAFDDAIPADANMSLSLLIVGER